jgi:hypothetical protein
MQFPQSQCCNNSYLPPYNGSYSGCGNDYPIVPGTNPALQTWNGQAFVVADGSAQNRISLPFLQVNSGAATYVVGADNNGIWSYYNPAYAGYANNINGGLAGALVYQSAPSVTSFTAVGTSGQVLTSNGTNAPYWSTNIGGNAATATTLATARNIAISGDVTGTATSFNGSQNISIPVTINAGSISTSNLSTAGTTWEFYTSNTERMRINASGDVGIGTSGPNAKLEVDNTSSANGLRVTVGAGSYSGNVALFGVTGSTNGFQIIKDAVNNIQYNFSGTGGALRMSILSNGTINTQGNPITNCPTTANAWGRASSAGVIDPTTFGVSTITRTALGNYLITMSTAISGYTIVATPDASVSNQCTSQVISTTQFRVYTYNGTGAAADAAFRFAVFGVF